MAKKKSDFVVIETVRGQLTADVIKSHLESEGIPVFLQCESAGRIYQGAEKRLLADISSGLMPVY